jgi:response regulator RpfG family c-di-GMP phosphodiesterase
MKFEDAIARIQTFVGTRYDPAVVSAFVEACEDGQIRPGSVKLKSRKAQETNMAAPSFKTTIEREPVPVS